VINNVDDVQLISIAVTCAVVPYTLCGYLTFGRIKR